MTTEWIIIACPHCEGRDTLAQLDVDLFIACPACHATGEIEVEDEVTAPEFDDIDDGFNAEAEAERRIGDDWSGI